MILSKTSSSEREKLRRTAGQKDQGPSAEDQSGIIYPANQMLKRLGDPNDTNNLSFPFLRRMREDHTIGLGLHLIEMGLLKAPWFYESDDARAAAFADNLIRPIYGSLIRTILRFLWAGYSPGVKRVKFVQPNWIYFKDGQAKKVWESTNVDACVYRPVLPLKPESARPRWLNGEFNGIEFDDRYGPGAFLINGSEQHKIDLFHSMWATHGQEGEDNSIYGNPRISHCAPIFHMYWFLWTQLARAYENNADPGPVMRYPQDDPATSDTDGKNVSPLETALRMGRRKRSGSTIALPSTPYVTFDDKPSTSMKWGIEYPKHETDFGALLDGLGMCESAKLIALWIPPEGATGTGVGGASSNRNTVTELSDLRDESQFVLMAMIDEFIDNVFVRPAFAINMPDFEGSIRKRTLGLSKDDEDTARQFFQLIGQQDWKNFGVDAQRLAEVRGLPMLDHDAREKQLQDAAQQATQAPTPPVPPTQGRRAMVTQTGFDETAYVQLEGEIEFAEDGDFVASLPRTDHFSDSAVLAQTRLLRQGARAFYAGLYNDFATYTSRQQRINFAEDQNWARTLVENWSPASRMRTFTDRLRRTLGKIFDRTAALKLKDLDSQQRITTTTHALASTWITNHGAELVRDSTDAVREELRGFLSRQIQKGSTPKEVASALRQEFSSWPDWKADRLARSESRDAFNFATLAAGKEAGIKRVQAADGTSHDDECRKRNGKIFNIDDALNERDHPNGSLSWRYLPQAELEVVREHLEDGYLARYDEETGTVLISPDLDANGERIFLAALEEQLASNGSASRNGKPTEEPVT